MESQSLSLTPSTTALVLIDLQRAVLLKPGYADAYSNLALACSEQGRLDEAAACSEHALRLGPDFIGKEFLDKQHKESVKRLVTGIVMEDKAGSPRHSAPVFSTDGREIGNVTSGSFSPSLGVGIALALLEVSVTLPPAQKVVGPPGVIVGVAGMGLMEMLVDADFWHPPGSTMFRVRPTLPVAPEV